MIITKTIITILSSAVEVEQSKKKLFLTISKRREEEEIKKLARMKKLKKF